MAMIEDGCFIPGGILLSEYSPAATGLFCRNHFRIPCNLFSL